MKAEKGNKVKVEYEGRFENGEVFDTSSHGDHSHPLEFEVGVGQVIKGFDDAVTGMKINEEKEITILPEEAYGQYRKELEREFPKKEMPEAEKLKAGMVLVMKTPEGHEIPVRITNVSDEMVTLDLNHPLAGKKLIFKLKLVEIN